MNKELKQRVINFIGGLSSDVMTIEEIAEADTLYKLLTRPPGRQKGWRKRQTYNELVTVDAGLQQSS